MTEPIGQRIKRDREARGWSQRDLAQKLGVSQQTVAHWEQGGTPRLPKRRKIAEVLEWNKQLVEKLKGDVPVADLLLKQADEQEAEPTTQDPIADDEIATIEARISEIHRLHAEYQKNEEARLRKEWGPRAPRTIVASMQPELRAELERLQRGLFERVLARLGAQGRTEATLTLGSFNRHFDYLSNKVAAEVTHVTVLEDRRILSGLRQSTAVLKLAVARAQRPELIVILIVVSEIANVEELRMMLQRTEFDAMSLGVSVRFVNSMAKAAEVIVATERAAPIVGRLNVTEEADGLEGHATVTTATTGSVSVTGHAPGVTISPAEPYKDDPEFGTW